MLSKVVRQRKTQLQQKSWHLDKSAGGRQANELKRMKRNWTVRIYTKSLVWQAMPVMTGVRSLNFELFHSKLKEKSFIFLSSKWLGTFHVCKSEHIQHAHTHMMKQTKRKERKLKEKKKQWERTNWWEICTYSWNRQHQVGSCGVEIGGRRS